MGWDELKKALEKFGRLDGRKSLGKKEAVIPFKQIRTEKKTNNMLTIRDFFDVSKDFFVLYNTAAHMPEQSSV